MEKFQSGSYLPLIHAFEGATKKNKDLKVSGSGNECSVWLSCLHTNVYELVTTNSTSSRVKCCVLRERKCY